MVLVRRILLQKTFFASRQPVRDMAFPTEPRVVWNSMRQVSAKTQSPCSYAATQLFYIALWTQSFLAYAASVLIPWSTSIYCRCMANQTNKQIRRALISEHWSLLWYTIFASTCFSLGCTRTKDLRQQCRCLKSKRCYFGSNILSAYKPLRRRLGSNDYCESSKAPSQLLDTKMILSLKKQASWRNSSPYLSSSYIFSTRRINKLLAKAIY